MKYPKLRELKEALTALWKGPCTIAFPEKPHTAFPGFRGKPVPDEKECIACGACAQVCPARAIEVKEETARKIPSREIRWHYDLCIYCGQCERLCTTGKGVKLSTQYDLAALDRSSLFSGIEKELVLCEDCGAVIAPRVQILWLARKLGPLAQGNFNLIFSEQNDLAIAGQVSSGLLPPPFQRQDLYRVLCPRCRHQAVVFNQTGQQP